MICLTTIIGYLGKYKINLLSNDVLTYLFKDNYDKKYFLYYIMTIYILSIFVSLIFYAIFKCIFYVEDKEKKEKKISICQIFGYIIYTEKKKPKTSPNRNCCTLCCESFQNCCNITCCHLLSICDICGCEPKCICSKCKYEIEDYNKKKEVFCYCYKTQRKSFSCNKFFANKTQKKLFPYMLEYFILQLTTVGFEKQYKKYKEDIVNIKTWTVVFITSFILFLYLTLSFSRMVYINNKFNNKEKKNKENERESKLEIVTKLSNKLLNGIHGILLFNGVFSIIFSIFYVFKILENIQTFFFKDNINIILIPILMNKFYYFTLNYYCIYTAEKYKKLEFIPRSSLISIYIIIYNNILQLIIKFCIKDNIDYNEYEYYKLYFVQIVASFIPSISVAIFIIFGLFSSLGLLSCVSTCNCKDCVNNFSLFKFLFCLFSYIFCCGGCWIKLNDFQRYEYKCCGVGDCCDKGGNCCCIYCEDNILHCDCCCCDKESICFRDCCYTNCNKCDLCGYCRKNK